MHASESPLDVMMQDKTACHSEPESPSWLKAYVLMSWGHMLCMTLPFFHSGFEGRWFSANTLFHVSAWPLYAMLYLLPMLLVAGTLKVLLPHRQQVAQMAALLTGTATLMFVWADGLVFELYSFHINRFVLNLVLTDGGIESLNSSTGTYLSVATEVVRIFIIQALMLFLAVYRHGLLWRPSGLRPAALIAGFFGLFLAQGITYGIGDVTNDPAVLEHAYAYPFFQKVRFRKLAAQLGYTSEHSSRLIAHADSSRLQYPLDEVTFNNAVTTPNIVWLVAESLRWDQLTPEIMPNTWRLAQQSWHYQNHYSSGNGTREGMFGMFYGLYGSYWDSFLYARQSPLLMDRLQALHYAFDLRTGAQFSYPEFDRTILANLPAANYHEADPDLSPWQRDQSNTTALIEFLQQPRQQPVMAFQFFESTHAPYFFPEAQALKTPYVTSLNYAELSKDYLAENVDGILNRYRNAGYWVDQQVGRIIASLEASGMLDDTLIIVTGDHGEEFMEKGNWGHNSTFVEEQTHVPLVLHIPGKAPKQVSELTSHMDIATTLLDLLGAPHSYKDYSLGLSLLDLRPRESINVSDWHSIAVVTADMKLRIPYISTGFDFWQPTDGEDHDLDSSRRQALMTRYQQAITNTINNTSVFSNTQ